MKENVDLTENRDFRKSSFPKSSLRRANKLIRRINNLDFPWSDVGKITSTINRKDEELFLVGNKNDRRYKIMYRVNEDKICERCGISLRRKPWILEYGLCQACDEIVSNVGVDSKCPWNKR